MTKPKTWKDEVTSWMSKIHTHNDAIAIIVTVHNYVARKVLFSNGNSSNFLYNDAMKKPRIF